MGYGPAYTYFVGVILGSGVQKEQERVLVAQYSNSPLLLVTGMVNFGGLGGAGATESDIQFRPTLVTHFSFLFIFLDKARCKSFCFVFLSFSFASNTFFRSKSEF